MRVVRRAIVALGLGLISTPAIHAQVTEDFEAMPSDPTWQAPDHTWQYVTGQASSGDVTNSPIGTIIPGGPFGKFGRYTGPSDAGANFSNAGNAITGSFSFLWNVHNVSQDFFPGDSRKGGADVFVLNNNDHINGGREQDRPDLSAVVQDDNLLHLQWSQGDGVNYYDYSSPNLLPDNWYQYSFTYDFTGGSRSWDFTVKKLDGSIILDDPGNFHIGASANIANIAHFIKSTHLNASNFDIDMVNVPVPEPTSLAVVGGIAGLSLLRRRQHPQA
jgi:hypothetical protein